MSKQPSSDSYVEHGIRRKGGVFQVRVQGKTATGRTLTEARKLRSELELRRGQKASRTDRATSFIQPYLDEDARLCVECEAAA